MCASHPIRALAGVLFAAALVLSASRAGAQPPPPTPEEAANIQAAAPDEPVVPPKQPRRMLVFYRCEGYVHASIPCGNEALRVLGEKTGAYAAAYSDDMSTFTAENLARYDAVFINNCTHLEFPDPAHRAALLDFVNGGKGVAGLHAATDNFFEWTEGAELIGGVFDGHPWGAGGAWAVKLDEPRHLLNAPFGGAGFVINDEIYQMKPVPYSREKLRVLVSLDMDNPVNVPGAREDNDYGITWIKRHGEGRVFYCSLGHNKHIYWNPAVLQHYLAGIQYALGDYELDDTPSNMTGVGREWMDSRRAVTEGRRIDPRSAGEVSCGACGFCAL
jgi:hypothetical protein